MKINSYKRFFEDKLPGGLADDMPDSAFDPEQLKKGMKVEREHTADEELQKEIAKDHITENPTYYDELAMIEAYQSKFAEAVAEEVDLTKRLIEMIDKVKMNLLDAAEIITELNDYTGRTGNMNEEAEILEHLLLKYKGAGDRLVKTTYKFLAKGD